MPKRLEKSNIISHSPLKRPDTPDPRNPDAVNWDFYRETNNLPAEVELALLERELKGKSKYHSRSSTFSSSTATSSSSAKSSKAVGLPPVYPSKSSSTGGSSLVRRHDEATPRLTISSSTSSPDNGGEPIRPRRQRTQAVMLTLDQLGNTTSFEDALFVSQLNVQNRLNQQPTTDATTVPPLDVTIPRLPSTMQRPRRQRTFAVSIPMERMVDLDTFNSPIINAFAREE